MFLIEKMRSDFWPTAILSLMLSCLLDVVLQFRVREIIRCEIRLALVAAFEILCLFLQQSVLF